MREQVDKIGPKVFKNFDKMKLIMRDPKLGHYQVRSQSQTSNIDYDSLQQAQTDFSHMLSRSEHNDLSRNASRGHSRNNSNSNNAGISGPVSGAVSAISDYTLTFQEQLDVNRAFNMINAVDGPSQPGTQGDDQTQEKSEIVSPQKKKEN